MWSNFIFINSIRDIWAFQNKTTLLLHETLLGFNYKDRNKSLSEQ